MPRMQHRPDEADRHRVDAFGLEQLARRAHVGLVQRLADGAVGQNPFAHTAPQIARHQHGGGRVFRVIAIAVFLVAKTDLKAVLMPGGADQAGLGPLVGDQRIQPHGGAVDAKVTVRDDLVRRNAQFLGDQLKAVLDGQRRVLRGGQRLEQPHLAAVFGQNEVGEGAARVDAQSILRFHLANPLISRPRRGVSRAGLRLRSCPRPAWRGW